MNMQRYWIRSYNWWKRRHYEITTKVVSSIPSLPKHSITVCSLVSVGCLCIHREVKHPHCYRRLCWVEIFGKYIFILFELLLSQLTRLSYLLNQYTKHTYLMKYTRVKAWGGLWFSTHPPITKQFQHIDIIHRNNSKYYI